MVSPISKISNSTKSLKVRVSDFYVIHVATRLAHRESMAWKNFPCPPTIDGRASYSDKDVEAAFIQES